MTDFSTETDEVIGGEMDVADVRWTSFSAARQETDWHKLKSTLGKGAEEGFHRWLPCPNGQGTGVVHAVCNCLVRISKIGWRLGRVGFGFVCLEFEVAGGYAETDEVFVGELDVVGVLGWQRFRDEFCFGGCR